MGGTTPATWTLSDVSSWLRTTGLGAYVDVFQSHEVDGVCLLNIEQDDLVKILGIKTLGAVKKIILGIDKLRTAQQHDVNLSCFLESTVPAHILEYVNNKRVRVGDDAEVDAFTTDDEYIEHIEVVLCLKRLVFAIQDSLYYNITTDERVSTTTTTTPPPPTTTTTTPTPTTTTVVGGGGGGGTSSSEAEASTLFARKKCVEQYIVKIEELVEKRIQVGESKGGFTPRMVRLAKKLALSDKELKALQFISMCNLCSPNIPLSTDHDKQLFCNEVSKHANMSCGDIIEFLRPTRKHMVQGLIETDAEYSTSLVSHFLTMSNEVLLALCGRNLTTDEFFKIDKTALAEVLTEEPGFKKILVDPSVSTNKKKPTKQDDGEVVFTKEEQDALKEILAPEELQKLLGSDTNDKADKKEDDTTQSAEEAEDTSESSDNAFEVAPYKSDLEYLEDQFLLLETKLKIKKFQYESDEINFRTDQRKPEAILREQRAIERAQTAKIEAKLKAQHKDGWMPRLEKLVKLRSLDTFEKLVLITLIGGMISHSVRQTAKLDGSYFQRSFNVETILSIHCNGLEQEIASRKYFYKNAKLIKEGIVRVLEPYKTGSSELMEASVVIDRKLLDYVVGFDTDLNEFVEGGDMIIPKVTIEQVVLPQEHKDLILSTLSSWSVYTDTRKKLGFDEHFQYGLGVVLLFTGPSGTGKTLTAHGIANFLGKKLLTLNLPATNDALQSKELLRFIFREAKIHDAIVFFDECEGLFETRDSGSKSVQTLLTEVEKYDGILIMASNRMFDLDEALHRRITHVIDFHVPSYDMRQQIWKAILPKEYPLSDDIDWRKLAIDYEIAGGFIKNAILSALSFAIARDPIQIKVSQADLERAAKMQLQGHLQMAGFERRVVPTKGLLDLTLPKDTRDELNSIVACEKARKVLVGQWGMEEGEGTILVLHGPNGAGKSSVAMALGYELGRPLKEYLCSELSNRINTKNIETIFTNAKQFNAIVVLHDCDAILGYSSNTVDPTQLLYYARHYPGIIVMTSISHSQRVLDFSLLGRSPFSVKLGVFDEDTRSKMWKKMLPPKAPISDDIDFQQLGKKYEFTAGSINNAIIRASEAAAFENKTITMAGLITAANEETSRVSGITTKMVYYQ